MVLYMSMPRSDGYQSTDSSVSDLVLTVQRLIQRVAVLEKAQARSDKKQSEWLSPKAAARASNSLYSEYIIRKLVDMAIIHPSTTRLIAGVHYTKVKLAEKNNNSKKQKVWIYKVLWPDFQTIIMEDTMNDQI